MGAVAFAAYWHWLRPRHLRWGATEAEVRRSLPGDELVNPRLSATHAITIHAPVAEVWPWLAQIGQGRGGFYSYTWIESLLGCDIHNNRVILEPGSFIMERKMLLGIKERAEGAARRQRRDGLAPGGMP